VRTVLIIQARMGSTRLPGKVLLPLGSKTVLEQVINRVYCANSIDQIVVATTSEAIDDPLVNLCKKLDVVTFRGDEQDVLSRYYLAAKNYRADVIVRVTADCPLYDGYLLEQMLQRFFANVQQHIKVDYLSNGLARTYPRGLDTEIFTFAALEQSHLNAQATYQREHVTPYIYQHPQIFNLQNFTASQDYSTFRWTLDTPADYEFIKTIYARLDSNGLGLFTTDEVLRLMQHEPELPLINAEVKQKALHE
jgi:spore coat polysaccharide biosynthesis protein SpsF